jgi:hypothetical protein
LPGIGTLYRAITGDQIPEVARRIGSLIVSTLIGGPIGLVTNIAMTIAEKVSGIDLDRTAQALLTGKGSTDGVIAQQAAPDLPTKPSAANQSGATAAAANPPATTASAGAVVAASPAGGSAHANPATPPAAVAGPSAAPARLAWSPAQLAAYGVVSGGDGTLTLAGVKGADVLNTLELTRIQDAQVAYSKALGLASG